MSKSTYSITLKANFKLPRRVRAGFEFGTNETRILELTKEQLEAFDDDPFFTVGDVAESAAETQADNQEATETEQAEPTQTSEAPTDQADQATPETEVEASAESAAETESEANTESDAPDTAQTVTELLQSSRAQLNDIAKEAGVADPESYENKQQVAEAIVAASI